MSKFIPNAFQIPNSVIDELLAKLTCAELKCYLFVVRKTKGWNKESDSISVSQFMEVTGLSNRSVITACESLVEMGLLERSGGERKLNTYSVKAFDFSESGEKSSSVKSGENFSESGEKSSSDLVKKVHTQNNNKNTIQNTNKKNIQKKPAILGLESHFEKFWSAGMRKVGKSQALKSFKSSYESYNAKYPLSLDDFTQMLVDDVVKRNQLCQFGFDKLHPVTYLNNWRWLDEYPQSNNKTTEKPSAHNNFGERDYGEQVIPEWALEGENDDEKSD